MRGINDDEEEEVRINLPKTSQEVNEKVEKVIFLMKQLASN